MYTYFYQCQLFSFEVWYSSTCGGLCSSTIFTDTSASVFFCVQYSLTPSTLTGTSSGWVSINMEINQEALLYTVCDTAVMRTSEWGKIIKVLLCSYEQQNTFQNRIKQNRLYCHYVWLEHNEIAEGFFAGVSQIHTTLLCCNGHLHKQQNKTKKQAVISTTTQLDSIVLNRSFMQIKISTHVQL